MQEKIRLHYKISFCLQWFVVPWTGMVAVVFITLMLDSALDASAVLGPFAALLVYLLFYTWRVYDNTEAIKEVISESKKYQSFYLTFRKITLPLLLVVVGSALVSSLLMATSGL